MAKDSITLSVIVIGRNEGQRLKRCLDSVNQITYPKNQLEVIYVDSQSSDGSLELAASKGIKTATVSHSKLTAALARNIGWNMAEGKYIFFLDADTVIYPDFISKALSEFDNPKIGVVSGHLRELNPHASIFNLIFDIDWDISARHYCGGNALIRREALEKVRGYNSDLIAGEEPEMCERLKAQGFLVKHISEPMALHDLHMHTFSQYWKRCFRSGYAYASIASAFKKTSFDLWRKESRHNFIKGGLMVCGGIFSFLALFTKLSFYPFAIYFFILVLLILRTLYKKKGKHSWKAQLLYAIHSHMQHIPIFFGQLSFLKNHYNA